MARDQFMLKYHEWCAGKGIAFQSLADPYGRVIDPYDLHRLVLGAGGADEVGHCLRPPQTLSDTHNRFKATTCGP
jgi:hypothetical protein